MATTRAPAQKANRTIEIPRPPLCAQLDGNAVVVGDNVVVTTSGDGAARTAGGLLAFDLERSKIALIPEDGTERKIFDLAQLKIVSLPKLRHWKAELLESAQIDQAIAGGEIEQPFELRFLDGDLLSGMTLGMRTEKQGLYLYPTQLPRQYIIHFIPHAAIESWRVGQRIGDVLVKEEIVNAAELQNALTIQAETRDQQIGSILRSAAVCTAKDLETSLEHQRQAPNLRIGDILLSERAITEEHLLLALERQKENRNKPLGEILVSLGVVTAEKIQYCLARKLGIPFVDLASFEFDPEIFKQLPDALVRKHDVLPLHLHRNRLVIAMVNPFDWQVLEDIRFHTKLYLEPVMSSLADIRRTIEVVYPKAELDNFSLEDIDEAAEDADGDSESDQIQDSDSTVVKLANRIIIDAYRRGASDIHIEPHAGKRKATVRFRKDGSLLNYYEVPGSLSLPLVSRLKIMANLDISERRKPQDGKISFRRFGTQKVELRVATLPTVGGFEDVVMRLLKEGEAKAVTEIDLSAANLASLASVVKNPHGLFFVCGPTGSGKTTTLHSVLGMLNRTDVKIWTAEDPVEITQPGLRQMQVNPKIGLGFATAMRSFLRADPDIIMVGEIRDQETAKVAIEASLTGHLVLSTLHTNSAPESIVRLLDLGMDPMNFSDAILGILAQRLAKRLCEQCKQAEVANEEEITTLAAEYCQDSSEPSSNKRKAGQLVKETVTDWRQRLANSNGKLVLCTAKGCASCEGTGYNGRVALHELLTANQEIKAAIRERASTATLVTLAQQAGMRSLRQDGIEKVLAGLTDMTQVRRVCIR